MPLDQSGWQIKSADGLPFPQPGDENVQVPSQYRRQPESAVSEAGSTNSRQTDGPTMEGIDAFSIQVKFHRMGAECIPRSIGDTPVHEVRPVGDSVTAILTGPYPDGGAVVPSQYSLFVPNRPDDGSFNPRGRLYSPRPGDHHVGGLKPGGGCLAWGGELSPETKVPSVPQQSAGCITYGSPVLAQHNSPSIVDAEESDSTGSL